VGAGAAPPAGDPAPGGVGAGGVVAGGALGVVVAGGGLRVPLGGGDGATGRFRVVGDDGAPGGGVPLATGVTAPAPGSVICLAALRASAPGWRRR
jgi:hypothetical protein